MNKRIWNILIGIDQLGNTILPVLPWPLTWPGVGAPDETISSTLGKLKAAHGGKIPWRWPFAKLIDWGVDKIDPNHSLESIEADEGENLANMEKEDMLLLADLRRTLSNQDTIERKAAIIQHVRYSIPLVHLVERLYPMP